MKVPSTLASTAERLPKIPEAGASSASVWWLAATEIFGWYVTNYGTYNIIYGPLGAAIGLLVWLYIISLIVLIGAEFNALIYPRTVLTAPSPSGGEPFTSGI